MNFFATARPACVNTNHSFGDEGLTATGWGRVEFSGDTSNDLLKVGLNVYDRDKCNGHYQNLSNRILSKGIDEKTQVCAGGGLGESKDTCQVGTISR